MLPRTTVSCVLVSSQEDKETIRAVFDVAGDKQHTLFFNALILDDQINLSVNEALRNYNGTLFKNQIQNCSLIIYCLPNDGIDKLDSMIVSAERNAKIAVIRIPKENISDIRAILNREIPEAIDPETIKYRVKAHYDFMLEHTSNIVNDNNYWQERLNPSVIKAIKKILKDDALTPKEKWESIVLTAQQPASSSTWMAAFVKERHPDTTEFCNVISQETEEALESFESKMDNQRNVNVISGATINMDRK